MGLLFHMADVEKSLFTCDQIKCRLLFWTCILEKRKFSYFASLKNHSLSPSSSFSYSFPNPSIIFKINFYWSIVAFQFSSVQFSCSVMSDSLQPHESQHTRPPCPSPTPGVHSDSCPVSPWCHPAISSSRPLLLLPPIPPSIRVFSNESTCRMRWPKYWGLLYIVVLVSAV